MAANNAMEAIGFLVYAYYELRDVEATLACVTDDIVWVGTENNDSAHGKEELRALLCADVEAFRESFRIELDEPVVKNMGDSVTTVWVTGHQVEVPGKIAGFDIRGTAVCVKTEAGWLVDSLHVSVPNTAIEKYSLAKELDENRKKLRLLMAHIPGGVAIYRVKKDGTVTTDFVSDGLARMLGYDDAAEFRRLVADDALVNVLPEDLPLVMQAAHRGYETHEPVSVMYHGLSRSGEAILERLDANMLESEYSEDDLGVWYAVHTRVSESSKAILQDQKQLHSLIDEVPTGIGVYEVDHGEARQSYMNDAFYAMVGQSREERQHYCGANTLNAVHPHDAAAVGKTIAALAGGSDRASVTFRLKLDDTRWIWVHLTASVVERREDYIKIYAAVSDYSEIMHTRRKLETNRNTLRVALDAAKVLSWRYDPKTGCITDSGMLGEAFGLPKRVEGMPQAILDMGFIAPGSEEDFCRLYREAAEEKRATADIQSTVKGEHGLRWFRQIYTPVYDDEGRCNEAIGIAIDISEQKHREQVYEDQLRLNRIATRDAISRVSMNLTRNTVTSFDSRAPEYAGNARFQTAEGLLHSVKDFIMSPEDHRKFEAVSSTRRMIEAYRSGTKHIEVTFHADRDVSWLRVVYDMMENPYTGDIEAVSAIHDVTEVERARIVMNQLLTIDYEAIALVDLETGRLIPFRVNGSERGFDEVMRLQAGMNDGEGGLRAFFEKYAVPGTAEKAIAENSISAIKEKLAHDPYYVCTFAIEYEGRRQYYRAFYSYVKDDSRVMISALQNITNIAEREEAQRAVLAEALAQAQAASKAKTAFLSRVSHDMRTPLNGILGLTSLMKDVVVSPKALQDLNQLEISGRYLLNLINDTLDVNRIESGKMELHPTVCDSRCVLNNVIRLTQPAMDAKGIRFTVDVGDVPMTLVYIDEARLQQVAMNILDNATKFTPNGGRIELVSRNLSVAEGVITDEFCVRDNGIGMSEEYLPHIFESFSQEDQTTTSIQKGTGLGMAITYQIVRLMGGDMEVVSKKGEGTCVRVVLRFPLATEEQVAVWRASRQPHAENYRLEGRRVLLCEDHPLNTQIATRLLKKVGVSVERAENGAKGIEAFAASAPGYFDAILMDIRMPVMDGLDAARGIRALGRLDAATIPILAMTANALDEDVRNSRAAGMNAHLSKPIDPEALYRTLERFVAPQTEAVMAEMPENDGLCLESVPYEQE